MAQTEKNILTIAYLNIRGQSSFTESNLNCIVDKQDATHYPEAKFSKGLQRLIKVKDWQDSYRSLYPNEITFSRYYENSRASGATRIDRCYHFGDIKVIEAKYLPIAFSDHFGHTVCLIL